MKIAYLILAHKNFEQLSLLVNQLAHPDVSFIIHIDAKAEEGAVKENLTFQSNADVHFLENRIAVNWGGFSVFRAIFYLLAKALDHNKYDYISLLSGQDFPIKSNEQILEYFTNNKGKEFISFHEIPYSKWPGNGGVDRINYFWLIDEIGWENAQAFAKNQFVGNASRQFPSGLKPYGGSMWFTITTKCAIHIYHFLTNNPAILAFFRYTMIPDELIIPTVVLNSEFRDRVVNDNLRYTDWSNGGAHPKTLTITDIDLMFESDAHIARKFDVDFDPEILPVIKGILNRSHQENPD